MDNKNTKTSSAQRQAVKKYLSKFVDVKIRVSAEERDLLYSHAKSVSESASAFIKRAIAETMERDQQERSKK